MMFGHFFLQMQEQSACPEAVYAAQTTECSNNSAEAVGFSLCRIAVLFSAISLWQFHGSLD